MSYTLLPKIQVSLPKNTLGTDYFVSDIQGEYERFMTKLKQVNFDYTKDRVIATGDLVDRGSNSLKCLKLLKEKWFHSVIGNHEMDILVYLVEPEHIKQIVANGFGVC